MSTTKLFVQISLKHDEPINQVKEKLEIGSMATNKLSRIINYCQTEENYRFKREEGWQLA